MLVADSGIQMRPTGQHIQWFIGSEVQVHLATAGIFKTLGSQHFGSHFSLAVQVVKVLIGNLGKRYLGNIYVSYISVIPGKRLAVSYRLYFINVST